MVDTPSRGRPRKFVTQGCRRCGGLLLWDQETGPQDRGESLWCCLNCGRRYGPAQLTPRALAPAPTRPDAR